MAARRETPYGRVDDQQRIPSEMTDQDLNQTSKRLLDAVGDVQKLEHRKRATARSTPEFHELAAEIEHKTRKVFSVAVEERDIGEEDSPVPAERAEQHPGDWTDDDAR